MLISKKKYVLLQLALMPLIIGCATVNYYKTGILIEKSPAQAGEPLELGRVFFQEEKEETLSRTFFSSLFSISVKPPEVSHQKLNPQDLFIRGRRTATATSVLRLNSAESIIDELMSVPTSSFGWKGAIEMGESCTPLFFDIFAIGEKNPEYELNSARCGESTLALTARIGGRLPSMPFELGHFTAADGSSCNIYMTREFEVAVRISGNITEEQAWSWYKSWDTIKDYVSASGQVFQITDSTGTKAYADCTKTDFTLYEAAAGHEDEVKMCIGMFIGFLYAIGV